MRRGGVLQRARHVSFARAPKSEVTAIPRRGFGGFPRGRSSGDRIWTEFGANRRGTRSREVRRDRPRSTEIDRDRPIFADLRSTSPASGPFDPIWAMLKPLNYLDTLMLLSPVWAWI